MEIQEQVVKFKMQIKDLEKQLAQKEKESKTKLDE